MWFKTALKNKLAVTAEWDNNHIPKQVYSNSFTLKYARNPGFDFSLMPSIYLLYLGCK